MEIERQAEIAPCSISLKDLFAGGLSQEAREAQNMYGQLAACVLVKMTAAMQITDTGVAFMFQAKVNQKLEKLRTELLNLAIHEETRPIFKCGYYESLKNIR